MAVEGVNNSNNTGWMNVAGCSLIAGGAGAGVGYLTKPFLKDGAPTDEFVKKMDENLKEIMTPEEKEIEKALTDVKSSITNAKSVEELKNAFVKNSTVNMTDEVLEAVKLNSDLAKEMLSGMGLSAEDTEKFLEAMKKSNNLEEYKGFLAKMADEAYAGKSLEEIKNAELASFKNVEKNAAKTTFEAFWDSSKSQFKNCEEGAGAAIKKAAKSIQGKYALIYAGIGAVAGGLGAVVLRAILKNDNKNA